MKKPVYLLPFLLISISCASGKRQPSSLETAQTVQERPQDLWTLEQALAQGPGPTLSKLNSMLSAGEFEGEMPDALRPEKTQIESDASRLQRLAHLRKFKPMSAEQKEKRAEKLLAEFQCTSALEAQALAMSLERNFPAESAVEKSMALHEKAVNCPDLSKQESLFRLTVFTIQKNQCPKAMSYLDQFPPTSERGVNDRIAYLRGFCDPNFKVSVRNPWGGYGIRLGEWSWNVEAGNVWFLSAKSGSEDWDRLLKSFVVWTEKGDLAKVRHWASRINYEKLRSLPYPFQASVLVVMHFAGADLTVFQTLHRFLAENPQLVTRDVMNLLFPVRYWHEIVLNSKNVDPVLVKSLIRQESAFNPTARSRARAIGLMQLIYPTARLYGIRDSKELLKPESNIRVGSAFLGDLIEKFGSVELALAAYNAGPDVVKEWKERYPTDNLDLFVEMIPYTETREYVRLVNRNYRIYQGMLQTPQKYQGLAQNLMNRAGR